GERGSSEGRERRRRAHLGQDGVIKDEHVGGRRADADLSERRRDHHGGDDVRRGHRNRETEYPHGNCSVDDGEREAVAGQRHDDAGYFEPEPREGHDADNDPGHRRRRDDRNDTAAGGGERAKQPPGPERRFRPDVAEADGEERGPEHGTYRGRSTDQQVGQDEDRDEVVAVAKRERDERAARHFNRLRAETPRLGLDHHENGSVIERRRH